MKSPNTITRLVVNLPENLALRVHDAAKEEGITLSELMRKALTNHVIIKEETGKGFDVVARATTPSKNKEVVRLII